MFMALIKLSFLLLFQNIWMCYSSNVKTFMYFAYGSNLLAKRIHINNPSAEFVGPALLKNYRLDFDMELGSWNGAVATIAMDEHADTWGTLWRLDLADMKNLDSQEGVDKGWYYPKNVTVTTPDGTLIIARTYIMPKYLDPVDILPANRRPSSTYLLVITLGAIESGLPAEYISKLLKYPSNGKLASSKIRQQLGYPY